ncbi:protein of unknown function [Nocardioides terrae]|uniref:DUF202 domain-containing protein n=1 Tax=Nocardioides terrae TaxID=574651 RepID=A0A1I1KIW9_9ACTN|nr:DUF202 domain-containing protein [Nocardioides terrae]SFC58628.1 protein of unknown function [Nocardioides terrae]
MSGDGTSDRTAADQGLQPERTALAWYRTCLSLAAGAAVAARYGGSIGVGWAVVLGVTGPVLALAAALAARQRYASARRSLASGLLATDGVLPALAAATLGVVGLGCATYVVGTVVS